ncbi:MAG: pirin [Proteobacteria bacterium]|nr:pirin [Pseudomonadota bacterium]
MISTRDLPSQGPWPTFDPFLFCVHHNDIYPEANNKLGPKSSLSNRNIGQDFSNLNGWNMYHGKTIPGFPKHPHRGFETITIVRNGLIDHADSLGAAARYGNGDVQWLTAGDGINHSEMFPLLNKTARNPIDFFQIWLNLPARSKRVKPHFSMFWDKTIPRKTHIDKNDRATQFSLIAGRFDGLTAPSPPPNSWAHPPQNAVRIIYATLDPHAQWTLPVGAERLNRALYFFSGSTLKIDQTKVNNRTLSQIRDTATPTLQAGEKQAEILLLEGMSIGEPVFKHGPFVMNTREEIIEAFADYRRTGFGGWPWSSTDPIHGHTSRRFARHANAKEEEPS